MASSMQLLQSHADCALAAVTCCVRRKPGLPTFCLLADTAVRAKSWKTDLGVLLMSRSRICTAANFEDKLPGYTLWHHQGKSVGTVPLQSIYRSLDATDATSLGKARGVSKSAFLDEDCLAC